MLQNGVGWTTSNSILNTMALALHLGGCARSPITPPIVPIAPIVPIVPVGPAPAAPRAVQTPAAVAPPISPSEPKIAVRRFFRAALGSSHGGNGLADGGQPLGDPAR